MVGLRRLHIIFIAFLIQTCNATPIKHSKDGNYTVLRGNPVSIPCMPPSEKKTGSLDLYKSFHWTGEDGSELSDSRFSKMKNGDLHIIDTHVADCGIYICNVQTTANSGSETPAAKTYRHKLIVYEVTGHKYKSLVSFDMSEHSSEMVINTLNDILEKKVCGYKDICESEGAKISNCEFSNRRIKLCQFSMSYAAVTHYSEPHCGEDCMRTAMIDKLNKAESRLQSHLADLTKNTDRMPLKVRMKTFTTHHLVTCNPGFHLAKSHKICVPCSPGTYSGPNSTKCHLCEVGKFQAHYGKDTCDECPAGKTTDNLGSKSDDECMEPNSGVFSEIKKGFLSIFS